MILIPSRKHTTLDERRVRSGVSADACDSRRAESETRLIPPSSVPIRLYALAIIAMAPLALNSV